MTYSCRTIENIAAFNVTFVGSCDQTLRINVSGAGIMTKDPLLKASRQVSTNECFETSSCQDRQRPANMGYVYKENAAEQR